MNKKACENCRFFHVTHIEINKGECRRNPPVVHPDNVFGVWPAVDKSDWCGKWKVDAPGHEFY